MTKNLALNIVFVISIIGLGFSGILSYRELFLGECQLAFVGCGVATGPIFGLPACVYGFFMYLLVFIFSLLGLRSKK